MTQRSMPFVSTDMDPQQVSTPNLSLVFLCSYFKTANQVARLFANILVSVTSHLQPLVLHYKKKNSELLKASSLSGFILTSIIQSRSHTVHKSTAGYFYLPGTFYTNKLSNRLDICYFHQLIIRNFYESR